MQSDVNYLVEYAPVLGQLNPAAAKTLRHAMQKFIEPHQPGGAEHDALTWAAVMQSVTNPKHA